ncbi:uncharacterized protein LOC129252147 isoform X1 [Anastrepha obliqua]|uniref:uncharacterized protein LOC129252147 isoform X1 n=1 Tax=Anastrepha obliqua TaxID=95512 RepID=UPI0024096FAC|nr:uncharacterized protein LOC129252147 isoform X1 [Anastrepha obliqua]
MSKRNFYEILKCTPTASFEELRRNYKQLILQCHPDKLQPDNTNTQTTTQVDNSTSITNDSASTSAATVDLNAELTMTTSLDQLNGEFVTINEAWNTLKDPTKRRHYDAELMLTKFQAHSNIFARLKLADMKRCAATATTSSGSGSDSDIGEYYEGKAAEGGTCWYYTYDCRCGGQYIVDESADSEILESKQKRTANDHSHNQPPQEYETQQKQMNLDNGIDKPNSQPAVDCDAENAPSPNCGSNRNSEKTGVYEDVTGAGDGDGDGDEEGEVLVECSECSLVIVLT